MQSLALISIQLGLIVSPPVQSIEVTSWPVISMDLGLWILGHIRTQKNVRTLGFVTPKAMASSQSAITSRTSPIFLQTNHIPTKSHSVWRVQIGENCTISVFIEAQRCSVQSGLISPLEINNMLRSRQCEWLSHILLKYWFETRFCIRRAH